MLLKKCSGCGKGISHSWYVFGGSRGAYRCVHCSVLLRKNKWHAWLGLLAGVFTWFFFEDLGAAIGSEPIAIILILLALYVVALALPVQWVLLPLKNEGSNDKNGKKEPGD